MRQNLGSDGTADKTLQWSVLSESPSSYAAKALLYKKRGRCGGFPPLEGVAEDAQQLERGEGFPHPR